MFVSLRCCSRWRRRFHWRSDRFFKTVNGARINNALTSVIATAMRAEMSLFDYLVALQRYQQGVRNQPKNWMPWNDQQTVDQLQPTELSVAA